MGEALGFLSIKDCLVFRVVTMFGLECTAFQMVPIGYNWFTMGAFVVGTIGDSIGAGLVTSFFSWDWFSVIGLV